ncbi:ABC transporter permease [Rubinisphaera sp.]|uniref:ABC transporter permease n=1 Tax=Rubinisphaera sp. TaxID=2024857 RepID=UPI000C1218F2|nr:ABC transporter permease [Rubinisphaera sp.]MBV10139.1 ABC transporter permease [Rubinisphaera sp.]HCS50980.1 ABC transporter permease [Planctomycetaceae bacterium]|tara:strand:+ start:2290 stop:3432 length:1143 start_codon:yes stop_codon:yes gene_type:complete
MRWLAWRMLTGDRTKYLGIVFGVAFGSLLIAQQASIFVGLMRRTSHIILDVTEPDIWVLDKYGQNVDEIQPMSENRLYQVRGVAGVDWAVKMYKGLVRVKQRDGDFRQAILIGIDDSTMIGAPQKMIQGSISDLSRPDAIIIDLAGYSLMYPGEEIQLGRTMEINDRRAVIVGICEVSAPFQTFPVAFTKYSHATQYAPRERNVMSFVLVKAEAGINQQELCEKIEEQTGLQAIRSDDFFWFNINYYIENTGIPVNFGITVMLGFIVGAAIAGQTFYLFTIENLKQFGTLKAMGVTNIRLLRMILLQALIVGTIGYSIGIAMACAFFEITGASGQADLRGMYVPWQVMLITAGAVGLIVLVASLLSIHKVLVLEPAVVFK